MFHINPRSFSISREIGNKRILISMVVVTAAAICVQLFSVPSEDEAEHEIQDICESAPFTKGITECIYNQNRQDNLCPLKVLGWILPNEKLDKDKVMNDVNQLLKNPEYAELIRKLFSTCVDKANAKGTSESAVADLFVNCWVEAGGSKLSKQAFCHK
ncbi:uncharacterized protein LOC135159962 [Diachasmimorpha longicaudata]|uniref:uncharacterized protein LOC135159962 n=1 Tax=Diachasmimorpha longicaudata TaxID=58733 RepID=UPI0030B8B3D8